MCLTGVDEWGRPATTEDGKRRIENMKMDPYSSQTVALAHTTCCTEMSGSGAPERAAPISISRMLEHSLSSFNSKYNHMNHRASRHERAPPGLAQTVTDSIGYKRPPAHADMSLCH